MPLSFARAGALIFEWLPVAFRVFRAVLRSYRAAKRDAFRHMTFEYHPPGKGPARAPRVLRVHLDIEWTGGDRNSKKARKGSGLSR